MLRLVPKQMGTVSFNKNGRFKHNSSQFFIFDYISTSTIIYSLKVTRLFLFWRRSEAPPYIVLCSLGVNTRHSPSRSQAPNKPLPTIKDTAKLPKFKVQQQGNPTMVPTTPQPTKQSIYKIFDNGFQIVRSLLRLHCKNYPCCVQKIAAPVPKF